MTDRPEITHEEAAWLLALAKGAGQPSTPGELGMPEGVRYSLLAKGCISLGFPLQLTPIGLSVVAKGPAAAPLAARAPVFLVSVDLPRRENEAQDDAACSPGTEPA